MQGAKRYNAWGVLRYRFGSMSSQKCGGKVPNRNMFRMTRRGFLLRYLRMYFKYLGVIMIYWLKIHHFQSIARLM